MPSPPFSPEIKTDVDQVLEAIIYLYTESRRITKELARRADRVIVLDRGRIAEAGTPMSLLDRDSLFAGIFDVRVDRQVPVVA